LIQVTLTSIGDAVITADEGGLVTLLNPAAESLTGWTNEGARGQPLRSVFHLVDETTRGRIEDTAQRAIASDGPVSLGRAAILVAAGGTERPTEGSAAPIHDSRGRAAGVVLVFRDASESRSVESALRREARLLEESHDAVFAWRLDGPILFWNRGAERLYGFSRREAEGRTRHDLLRTEYPGGSRAALEAALARESEFQGELVHARKGGGRVPVESRIQVMRTRAARRSCSRPAATSASAGASRKRCSRASGASGSWRTERRS
jgi:PAS domain S-box-containing protein